MLAPGLHFGATAGGLGARLGEQFGVGLQLATGHVLERSTDVTSEVLCPDGVPADGPFTSVMFQPGMVSVLTSCMVVLSSLWGTIDPEQYRECEGRRGRSGRG